MHLFFSNIAIETKKYFTKFGGDIFYVKKSDKDKTSNFILQMVEV